MLEGARSLIMHRMQHDWFDDFKEILGNDVAFSTFFKDDYTVVLLVNFEGETLRFEEAVVGFPSATLRAQLMLISKVA